MDKQQQELNGTTALPLDQRVSSEPSHNVEAENAVPVNRLNQETGSSNENRGNTEQTNQLLQTGEQVTTGLLQYLKKTTAGKEILKAYSKCKEANRLLPRRLRSKLVRVVIDRERDWLLKDVTETEQLDKFVIRRERFIILANEISNIFEGENPSTYYIPFTVENKRIIPAGGKLWDHFNYNKSCLRRADLLKSRGPNTIPYTFTENDHRHIEWLSSHLEPWQEVEERWVTSFEARREILRNEDLAVCDYIKQFPCLTVQNGTQLFFIDFAKINPGKSFIDLNTWSRIKECLIQHLTDIKIGCVDDAALMKLLQSGDLSEAKQDFIVFYLISYIIPPKRSVKRKKNDDLEPQRPHRLTLEERRESFIFRVQTASDIEPQLDNYKERLRKSKKTFQPLIVAVGSPTNITKFHVAVNNQLYDVHSIIEAIKLTLAIYFSLDCKYHENTETIWVFLQRIFANVKLPIDVLNVQSNIILGHIQKLLSAKPN